MKRESSPPLAILFERGEIGAGLVDDRGTRPRPCRARPSAPRATRSTAVRKRAASSLSGANSAATAASSRSAASVRAACSAGAARDTLAAPASAARCERVDLRLAALDRVELGAQLAHPSRQLVGLAAVLAGERAQLEQARLDAVELARVVQQRLGRRASLSSASPASITARSSAASASASSGCSAAIRSSRRAARAAAASAESEPSQTCRSSSQVAGQPLALLHVGAGSASAPPRRLRLERGQLGEVRQQQVLVGPRRLDLRRARRPARPRPARHSRQAPPPRRYHRPHSGRAAPGGRAG